MSRKASSLTWLCPVLPTWPFTAVVWTSYTKSQGTKNILAYLNISEFYEISFGTFASAQKLKKKNPKNALLPVLGGQWAQRHEGAIKMRNGPTNLTSGSRVNSILLRAKQINCLIRVSTPCTSPRLFLGGNANEKNSQIV